MPSQHVLEVLAHKELVTCYLFQIADALCRRAVAHDLSKFSPEESATFERVTPMLSTCVYGSPEYLQSLRELGPALQHHYAVNRHHPEYFADGIAAMDLIDLVEMVCDWLAALQRTHDGSIERTIRVNQPRFAITDQLTRIIEQTMRVLADPSEQEGCAAMRHCDYETTP